MGEKRPIVLSIAGLDPSGGAGLLADIKTIEEHRVYGLGVCTAVTLQTESEFISIRWESREDIIKAVEKMLLHYTVSVVKIGVVENMTTLEKILNTIVEINKGIKIVVDPVIESTSGYSFWNPEKNGKKLLELLPYIFLITPNYHEMKAIYPSKNPEEGAFEIGKYCNVLLKGGHNQNEQGVDILFSKNNVHKICTGISNIYPKHGSGCILSSAIACNLALESDIKTSCESAKHYIEKILCGNESLLAYHHV